MAKTESQRFVQVVTREFPMLMVHYPILLSKDSETGSFYCGAMLGIDPGENLFLAEPGKQVAYRPLNLQRMPFFSAGDSLAIDLDNPHVHLDGGIGESLFEDDGGPSVYLRTVGMALETLKAGITATQTFIRALLDHQLVAPIDVDLSFDDGSSRNLTGLYTIDQEALAALPDDAALHLFRAGYLQSAYQMIASVKQIPVLAARKNDRLPHAESAVRAA